MPQGQHWVRLAAAEVDLQLHHRVAPVSDKALQWLASSF
jgi:hypothetical protein